MDCFLFSGKFLIVDEDGAKALLALHKGSIILNVMEWRYVVRLMNVSRRTLEFHVFAQVVGVPPVVAQPGEGRYA